MKSLIIGVGQVGRALQEVLSPHYEVLTRDIEECRLDGIEVMHICYPDQPHFDEITTDYIDKYKPTLTIINSSVAVGTTAACGRDVVYSPIRGRHPNLADEMKKFVKFVASHNQENAVKGVNYFEAVGWPCKIAPRPETLEFLKIMSNVHLGLEIVWRQDVERMMGALDIYSVDYDLWEKTYRDGYLKTKEYNLIRSLMKPDPIGGHCILSCVDLLKKSLPSNNSFILDYIVESNEEAKGNAVVANHH